MCIEIEDRVCDLHIEIDGQMQVIELPFLTVGHYILFLEQCGCELSGATIHMRPRASEPFMLKHPVDDGYLQ